MMTQEWFTVADLAAERLPDLPVTESGVARIAKAMGWNSPDAEGRAWRKRAGRGGGAEYHFSSLPAKALAIIVRKYAVADAVAAPVADTGVRAFVTASDRKKAEATRRLNALRDVELLAPQLGMTAAIKQVAATYQCGVATIYNWRGATAGTARHDVAAALVPQHQGRSTRAPCSDEAWQFLLALYLRQNRPNFRACFSEVRHKAQAEGWTIPSASCLERRIQTDVPVPVRVLMRDGVDAMKRLYPYQERDRSMFHALEAVNADGHKWDMNIKWPDGSIGRPMMVAFQDLYSNLILSWRVDKSENKEMVRLAFADLVKTYGIPKHCWLDNGRSFASKWLTGGIQNRFRFKIREEEPHGILPLLGVEVHWTLPYSGQSKPIERAFGEFAGNYAKHPRFAGAGVGNSPVNKPDNYGEKAIDLDVFLEVAATCIAEHNAREGRRTKVCGGKLSFQQAFNASYATSTIAKATEDHMQLLLLAAEGVKISPRDGSFKLQDNRYWSEKLLAHRGQPIVARFDPQALLEEVQVYSIDGKFICAAELQGAARFDDATAAQDHARARNAFKRAVKEQAAALLRMTQAEAAALTRTIDVADPPETKVVRLFRGATALQEAVEVSAEHRAETEDLFVRRIAARSAQRGQHLQLVEEAGDD
jgi:transposase InsO family protein